jgi:threonine dehydrogenase-like Zn-dependent dehydrogenase
MESTRALWHTDSARSEIRTDQLEVIPSAVTVDAAYSLISLGTELLIARDLVPPEMHHDMTVPYMMGDFPLPIKYGYSLTGTLRESGTPVHTMHPHQNICNVDPTRLFEIPSEIPLKRATLASNLETALNAVWDARLLPGERAVIVGCGMIGSLVTRIASEIPACHVEVFDPHQSRMSYAKDFGFDLLEDPDAAIEPFDVAFHCSGTGAGLQRAMDLVGKEGRIIELSWYGMHPVKISLGGTFHNLRKKIISSQVGSIPPHMGPLWGFHRRKKAVFELLKDSVFDQHITHEVSLEEAASLFKTWRHEKPDGLGYCICYDEND